MKTRTIFLKAFACMLLTLTVSCAARNGYGSAHDRTGTNGATNGNGKAPNTSAHSFRY